MEDMGIEDNKFFPLFHRWGKRVDRKIGGYKNFEDTIGLFDVVGDTVTLPECAVAVYPGIFILGTGFDFTEDNLLDLHELHANVRNRASSTTIMAGSLFSIDVMGYPSQCNWMHYKINQDQLRFYSREFDGRQALVPYLKYPTDDEGYILVYPENQEAIKAGIHLMYAKRTRFGAMEKRISRGDLKDLDYDYNKAVSYARGEQAEPDTLDSERISVLQNSPYTGSLDFYWLNEPNNSYTLNY